MRMQDVVDLATSEPPPPRYTVDEIVEAGKRSRRRRRLGRATSGASAVIVLGVVAAVGVPSLGHRVPPATPVGTGPSTSAARPFPVTAPPFTFTFDGYRVGTLRVGRPVDVSTAYQLAPVYSDDLTTDDQASDPNEPPAQPGPRLYAYLTVYRPGAYDPAGLARARQVTVAGRPGLEASDPGTMGVARTLAWQYGTNAWAVITASSTEADDPSADDLRRLAAGLRPATPAAAKTPIRMRYVPPGYRLDEAGVHAMTGLDGIAAARDGDYAGLLFSRPALPVTGLTAPFGGVDGADPPGSFVIFVVPAANANQRASQGVTCLEGFCNRWFDNGSVNVQVASRGPGGLSNGDMTRILAGITLGDVHDEGTWTEVSAAVP